MNSFDNIAKSLEKLQYDFNNQISVLGKDPKEFHNALIDLSSKYPEHKEMLQFIVSVNDKLETNQTILFDIVIESFNEMINLKKDFLNALSEKHSIVPWYKKIDFKDLKFISAGVVITVLILTELISPGTVFTVFSSVKEVTK